MAHDMQEQCTVYYNAPLTTYSSELKRKASMSSKDGRTAIGLIWKMRRKRPDEKGQSRARCLVEFRMDYIGILMPVVDADPHLRKERRHISLRKKEKERTK